MRATWPRERLEAALVVLRKATSLEAACLRLRVSRHKLRRAFAAAGLANPSEYLTNRRDPPEYIPQPQIREPEPEPRRIQPPPSWEPVKPKPSPLRKPLKNEAVRTYFVVSDVHVPYHARGCTDAVADLMRDLKPDGIVCAGDFLDFLELSSHNAGSLAKLEGKRVSTTFDEGCALLDQWLRAAGPQCRDNHFLDGNHEDRINRWLSVGTNGVWAGDESVSIERRLGLKERGFKYHQGDRSGVLLGKLWVTHGHFTGKYHPAKHVDHYRHCVMYGHCHTPGVYHASALHAHVQVGIGLGHLSDPTSDAMAYAPGLTSWVQGFALVFVFEDDTFCAQPINFWNGRFCYAGKIYGSKAEGRAIARAVGA